MSTLNRPLLATGLAALVLAPLGPGLTAAAHATEVTSAAPAARAADRSLVGNGSFAEGRLGWAKVTPHTRLAIARAGRSSTNGAVLTRTGRGSVALTDAPDIRGDIEAGDALSGAVWVRAAGKPVHGYTVLREIAADGRVLKRTVTRFRAGHRWTKAPLHTLATATGSTFDLNVVGRHVTSRSKLFVDDVSLLLAKGSTSSSPSSSPASTNVLVSDLFDRTVSSGWGTAPTGGTWALSNTTGTSVGSGVAKVTGLAAGKSVLSTSAATALDTSATMTFSVPALPTGGGEYVGVNLRQQGDKSRYSAKVRITSTGALTLTLSRVVGGAETAIGSTWTSSTPVKAGQAMVLDATATGTDTVRVAARIRPASQTAPAWQVSADDASASRLQTPGAVGTWVYNSASATRSVALSVADVTATGQTPSSSTPTNVAPTADFTSSASDLTASVDASGSSDSDGTVASYAWTFGDGSSATGKTANHTYYAAGTYTVGLTVTDDKGATATTTRSVTVTAPNAAPTAAFTQTSTDLTASVDASGSSDTDGTVYSYAWTFGDGSSATGRTASHTYGAAGTYTVGLTVTDDRGATGTTTKSVTVTAPNAAPTAAFTTSASGLTASVDASGSADSDGTVASYAWTFGDGSSATGKTGSHTYAASGTYTVALTVTDNRGATATTTKSVTVTAPNAAPTASFTSSASGLTASVDASGSADSDGTVASYAWSFGDGSSATGKTASHTYAADGTYAVVLTVTDDKGATASVTKSVTVSSPAVANRPANDAGAAPLGSTSYPIPSGAVFVSPSGSDTSAGSLAAPVKTIQKAVSLAPAGGTIVLRGGTYHESVTISSRAVTIQNYPGEVVWLDGSSAVTDWVQRGSVWVKSGWTPRFDSSPSYTKGTPDGAASGWVFLNQNYPMAAHPDQVFIDGVAQQQVDSAAKVVPGTFYLDESTSELIIGSDPTGHAVRASDLSKAISVRYNNVVLRGFGVRRYANSIWMIGAVTLERTGDVMENMVASDNATIGIGTVTSDITLNKVTAERNGLMGVSSNASYNFKITNSRFRQNNDEFFNPSPASGGVKICRSRGLLIKNNDFSGNYSKGLWMDESVYDAKVVGNNMVGNTHHGVSFEISSHLVFADNLVLNNGGQGIKINDSDSVELWNNTFVGNARNINIVQDTRRGTQTSTPGHDPQQPNPDPTEPWIIRNISSFNNVVSNAGGASDCMVCVEDYSKEFTGDGLNLDFRGNVYNRPTGAPSRFAVWANGASSAYTYTTLAAFRTARGQEAGSASYDGSSVLNADGSLTATGASTTSSAVPLSATVAGLLGRATGARSLGAWVNG